MPATIAAAVGLMAAGAVRADAPDIVVTVKPLHALVAGVSDGVATPHLLIKGAASPHTYVMRPSDARATERADVIFWIGPELETFFERTVGILGRKARVVALADEGNLTLLEAREGGSWEAHDDDAHDDHGHDDHASDKHDDHDDHHVDGHVWLDPNNARKIVDKAVAVLSEIDPENAGRYAENGDHVHARIDAMDRDIATALMTVKSKPYVVFHDAYQYFERHYGLNAAGSITTSPEKRPGAKRLYEIRKKITQLGAVCVFSEPQFEPALVNTLIEGTPARTGELDPMGIEVQAGPDAYVRLMTDLANAIKSCLQPAS